MRLCWPLCSVKEWLSAVVIWPELESTLGIPHPLIESFKSLLGKESSPLCHVENQGQGRLNDLSKDVALNLTIFT